MNQFPRFHNQPRPPSARSLRHALGASVTVTVTVTALALAAGCSADPGPNAAPDGGPPTYENVQAIFTRSCAQFNACHNASGAGGMLVLAPGMSLDQLIRHPAVQVPHLQRVVPGDPDHSYLMTKLDGTMNTLPECRTTDGSTPCGLAMPQSAPPLAPELRNAIREWIRAGAPGPLGARDD